MWQDVNAMLLNMVPGDANVITSRAFDPTAQGPNVLDQTYDHFIRFKCETVDDGHGGTQLQYCNCHGSGCNENWNTAAPTATSSRLGLTVRGGRAASRRKPRLMTKLPRPSTGRQSRPRSNRRPVRGAAIEYTPPSMMNNKLALKRNSLFECFIMLD